MALGREDGGDEDGVDIELLCKNGFCVRVDRRSDRQLFRPLSDQRGPPHKLSGKMHPVCADANRERGIQGDQEDEAPSTAFEAHRPGQGFSLAPSIMTKDYARPARQLPDRGQGIGQALVIRKQKKPRPGLTVWQPLSSLVACAIPLGLEEYPSIHPRSLDTGAARLTFEP